MMTSIPAMVAEGAVCTAGGVLSWAAVSPSSQIFGPTIRSTGDRSVIALTFDDGPNPNVTPRLLDLLARHQVRASFFLIGIRVRALPSLVKEIASRGHTLGNHTDTHPRLTFLSSGRITEELARCDDALVAANGRPARWMRPPFGFRGPQLAKIVLRCSAAAVVMWSRSARDWTPQAAAPVIKRLRRVRGGDIVLLHDGDHRVLEGNRLHTVEALGHWLPRWKDAGFRFVSLDELHP
jgi:peptidoglycan-N-acetylglucosamine deacetylase